MPMNEQHADEPFGGDDTEDEEDDAEDAEVDDPSKQAR